MKSLFKSIKRYKQLIFLDLEGTQFTHELIALGAIKAIVKRDFSLGKTFGGLKFYVQSDSKVGRVVTDLTGITDKIVHEKGTSFNEAMKRLKSYAGKDLKQTAFITFGSHDIRILNQSLQHNDDGDANFVQLISRQHIDLSAILSQYIKNGNNTLSLSKFLELFNLPFEGTAHDPLCDAINLMHLYNAVLANRAIILKEYQKVLYNMTNLPAPILYATRKLLDGENVSSKEFINEVDKSI